MAHIIRPELDVYASRTYFTFMHDHAIRNRLGALSVALADELTGAAEANAPERGVAAAALVLAAHEPGLSIERLRRAVGLSHPGAVRLVDRLVAHGLIARGPAEDDRRAVGLGLTASGTSVVNEILHARGEALDRVMDALNADERTTLGQLLEKMLRVLLRDLDHAYAICRLCEWEQCDACPIEGELDERGAT